MRRTGRRAGPWRATRERLAALATPDSPEAERDALVLLVGFVVAICILTLTLGVEFSSAAMLAVPLLMGGMSLRPRMLWVLFAVAGLALAVELVVLGFGKVRIGELLAVGLVALVAHEFARSKEALGISAPRRESMLLELRQRLDVQGELPPLPEPWRAELVQRSAGMGTFGGDFIVSARTADGARLELCMVDVSGKGIDAGTRALLLSGALGGLLGSVSPGRFMPAANHYLIRQGWEEGFATAVHLSLELATGRFTLTNAGHLPPVHFRGGSGRWELVESDGTALGIHAGASFGVQSGQLRPHDALLLYTDGLVEVPGRDLSVGIDRLLGEAERLVPRGFVGGATSLVDAVAPHAHDDRALMLLWRT